VSFDVAAEAYDRFIGRFSRPLAADFIAFAGVGEHQRALDVGCGTGSLTAELVQRLGPANVAAVDPSGSFVEAAKSRFPAVDIRPGTAERLPFDDAAFDCALAQLVVHFMTDPVTGLREMGRVTRHQGTVAACVWDHGGGSGPLAAFWRAVRTLDPKAHDQSAVAGGREGHLAELLAEAGMRHIESATLAVRVGFGSFDEWWEPYLLGVGPAGDYVAGLDATQLARLRARCAEQFPRDAPFEITATAWAAAGRPAQSSNNRVR
jgi:SAM-dependent methyltransferase